MAFKDCFFRQNPLCAMCKAEGRLSPATELDHKVPLFRGGKDFDEDPGQAQGLCAECHKNKTAQDLGYRQKREIGADGWPVAQ